MLAGLIGLGGGLIGLVLSHAVSVILNKVGMQLMGDMGVSRSISIISPELALGAVVFSSLVGLVSGFCTGKKGYETQCSGCHPKRLEQARGQI